MKELVGKRVRMIVWIGNATISIEGILKSIDDWITLEMNGKKRVVNKDSIVYVEER